MIEITVVTLLISYLIVFLIGVYLAFLYTKKGVKEAYRIATESMKEVTEMLEKVNKDIEEKQRN